MRRYTKKSKYNINSIIWYNWWVCLHKIWLRYTIITVFIEISCYNSGVIIIHRLLIFIIAGKESLNIFLILNVLIQGDNPNFVLLSILLSNQKV